MDELEKAFQHFEYNLAERETIRNGLARGDPEKHLEAQQILKDYRKECK